MDYSDFIKKYQGHSAEFLIYDLMKRIEVLEDRFEPTYIVGFEPDDQQKRIAELKKAKEQLEKKLENVRQELREIVFEIEG